MIYNLVEYLATEFATYKFVTNGFQKNTADTAIQVSESGGSPAPLIDRNDFIVQLFGRGLDKTVINLQLKNVYDKIHQKYGLTLPEVTVNTIVYPEVKTWEIIALQLPGFIGNDESGRAQFSVNFNITTE